MRLLPHLQDTGGFFVAVLRKQTNLSWQKSEVTLITSNQNERETPEAK